LPIVSNQSFRKTFLRFSSSSDFGGWFQSNSSRAVLALLRSDPTGLLAREYMFDADSEGVIELFESSSS
jgi:hypothetical protein